MIGDNFRPESASGGRNQFGRSRGEIANLALIVVPTQGPPCATYVRRITALGRAVLSRFGAAEWLWWSGSPMRQYALPGDERQAQPAELGSRL